MSDGPRRTWAPFVGAALAALTAGSLVVFALVAQRTSLDGFPELRIAAPAESATGRPASITVAPVGSNEAAREVVSTDGADSGEVVALTQPEGAPLTLIPLVPATGTSSPLDLASLDGPAPAPLTASGSRGSQDDDALTFDGRFRADGELLAAQRDGGSSGDGARAGDARRGGNDARKSHDAKSKKNEKNKKSKKQKRSNHGASHRRSRGRAHPHGPQGSSHAAAPSASRSSDSQNNSHQSAAPRPKPSPQGPPAHSNAGGNGKSNGKGHKKH